MTDGQAACIAWNTHYAEEHGIEARNEWAASDPRGRAAWEAAAEAAQAPLREKLAAAEAALARLADEDTQVLDSGLGGGDAEELHVRVNLARQALGLNVCGCTECTVSLGLEPDAES